MDWDHVEKIDTTTLDQVFNNVSEWPSREARGDAFLVIAQLGAGGRRGYIEPAIARLHKSLGAVETETLPEFALLVKQIDADYERATKDIY